MAVDETPSTGPCGLQDPVSFGEGNTVSAKVPRARDSRISQEGFPGSAGISPQLVSAGDWSGTGPYPFAHGDSTEVRGVKGRGAVEECHESAAERELSCTWCAKCIGMVAEFGHEDFSPPQWASTRPRFGTMSSTKASRRWVKRSLNCEEPPPGRVGFLCAGHDEELRGGSPLRAVEIGTASLGQGVESDLESEGSRGQSEATTNRNRIGGRRVLGNPTMTGYPIIDQGSTVVDPAWPQERDSSYPGRSHGVSGPFPDHHAGNSVGGSRRSQPRA